MISPTTFLDGRVTLYPGDCREVIAGLPDASVDSVVTDPPYHLTTHKMTTPQPIQAEYNGGTGNPFCRPQARAGFMGKKWDGGDIAFDPALWSEVLRVLKPGGHMVAFSGTRTYHRMVCAIEDAGFEIRDQVGWVFGSGFPKSHDVSKGIDRAAGAEREKKLWRSAEAGGIGFGLNVECPECGRWMRSPDPCRCPRDSGPASPEAARWQGWGTALKPAWEPICLARKPLIGTVAQNVLAHGTGAINIDACRIGDIAGWSYPNGRGGSGWHGRESLSTNLTEPMTATKGRWPANLVHDGSEEVLAAFPDAPGMQRAVRGDENSVPGYSGGFGRSPSSEPRGDIGSAARFFYSAKADSDDRVGSSHPTVKPVDLMRWLCRLITPPGGTCLDPFSGTGTTAEAAYYEGFSCILIEREAEYQADIERRMRLVMAGPDERIRESAKARANGKPVDHGPLFNWVLP